MLKSLRPATARCSNGCFLILLDHSDLHQVELKILSQITEEDVKDGDYNELGEGIEVGHSSCIVHLSGVVNEKDETYIAPNEIVFHAPLTDSLEPSPFHDVHLLLDIRFHDLDLLLQISQIICSMLVVIVQFTQAALLAGLYAVKPLTFLWRIDNPG